MLTHLTLHYQIINSRFGICIVVVTSHHTFVTQVDELITMPIYLPCSVYLLLCSNICQPSFVGVACPWRVLPGRGAIASIDENGALAPVHHVLGLVAFVEAV